MVYIAQLVDLNEAQVPSGISHCTDLLSLKQYSFFD